MPTLAQQNAEAHQSESDLGGPTGLRECEMSEGKGFKKDVELAEHKEHSLFLNWHAGNGVFSFDFPKKNKRKEHLACGRP